MGLFSKDIQTFDDLFIHKLRDIYYTENEILKALPKMISKASDSQLKQSLETHLQETEEHVARLEEVFRMHGVSVGGIECPAIGGIIEEANEIAAEVEDPEVLDAAIIAAAQGVEHYEIVSYGTLVAWANRLGRTDCAGQVARGARIRLSTPGTAAGTAKPKEGSVAKAPFFKEPSRAAASRARVALIGMRWPIPEGAPGPAGVDQPAVDIMFGDEPFEERAVFGRMPRHEGRAVLPSDQKGLPKETAKRDLLCHPSSIARIVGKAIPFPDMFGAHPLLPCRSSSHELGFSSSSRSTQSWQAVPAGSSLPFCPGRRSADDDHARQPRRSAICGCPRRPGDWSRRSRRT